ncbi:hypothetical protein Goari_000699 [Gossypium aridum]|uniref:Uncharacterized protein n=1 Tax=Gossypium aridum TaxID=34290 RepID=A0A7J8YHH5_GOSAI|nr:hypothetical protein [Gossypium aridum]
MAFFTHDLTLRTAYQTAIACLIYGDHRTRQIKTLIFPLPLPYSSLVVSTTCPGLSPGIRRQTYKAIYRHFTHNHSRECLYPLYYHDRNACILYITMTAGTELASAYSPDTIITSSPRKEVHDLWAFYLHAALLCQAFADCEKFPIAPSHRSLGRVSIPVWLIILSN